MRRFPTSPIPVGALTSRINPVKLATPPRSVQAGSYDCTPTDNFGTGHSTVVASDRTGEGFDLKFISGQRFTLNPVMHASDCFYSGPLDGWRADSNVSVPSPPHVAAVVAFTSAAQTAPGSAARSKQVPTGLTLARLFSINNGGPSRNLRTGG